MNTHSINTRNEESSRKRLYWYTFVVLLISVAASLPIFFEFKTVTEADSQRTFAAVSTVRMNEYYIIMVFLNAKIIFKLLFRKRIRSFGNERQAKNEMNLAKVLVAMDLVFLFCNLGRVTVNIWEVFQIGHLKECFKMDMSYKVKYIIVK